MHAADRNKDAQSHFSLDQRAGDLLLAHLNTITNTCRKFCTSAERRRSSPILEPVVIEVLGGELSDVGVHTVLHLCKQMKMTFNAVRLGNLIPFSSLPP